VPAGLKITLTKNEDRTLQELELAKEVPRRTKCRASVLRLNSREWTIKAIAEYLEWAESTVRQTIHRWNKWGLAGLWETKGRGKKPSWSEEDWQVMKQWLNEPSSLSSRQLSQRLARERQVLLGAEQVRRILKKKVALEKTEKKTSSHQ
jgi:transposase